MYTTYIASKSRTKVYLKLNLNISMENRIVIRYYTIYGSLFFIYFIIIYM